MNHTPFDAFFQGVAGDYLRRAIIFALDEDGADLTSHAVFTGNEVAHCVILAKEETICAGLPVIDLVLDALGLERPHDVTFHHADGDTVSAGTVVAEFACSPIVAFKAERVILNFVCHLSGIANLTRRYVDALAGTRTVLLDTRKTLPCLRYPEKYAVLLGGGKNHRMDLAEMLMLKDNHIDQAGGISPAVQALRRAYTPCPPIEVECRTLDDVSEAVALGVDRIMLDNMDPATLRDALARIPEGIESEVSGGVNLSTIADIGRIGPDFVSVGRLTHSAPAADFSMRVRITNG
ncbi:nicotinate-nucleotide pyrophosphorylase (carboxylating) [Desulfobaculum xiamenense]|uniref:nicotinate-nucleotide diphosphorylase (carboxylating) n=1 Tax=Desulfobaculum xiamenense TaxID=995050 RepID=A0A846QII6_9BACT|nr:carboxylating nicotinate-nucleotide diphosphorylase [Desulfobaculum xiamenense]NJB66867.1 nicotinate-nucleotide pyrophosphorylase (carboxylating) [Desulfobaculum xiamenense]